MAFLQILLNSIAVGIIGIVLINFLFAGGIEIMSSNIFTTFGTILFFVWIFFEMMMAFY